VEVDSRHAHQPAHLGGAERRLGERAVDLRDLLVKEGDLAQATLDRVALVVGELEALQVAPSLLAREVVDLRSVERFRCSAAPISFFARVRWRTSWARRATQRRSALVASSGHQTSAR
jgi:hypothetical protein